MKKDIIYITIDARGEHETFKDCITKAIENLKPGEGIHVIKDFEPFPMYKMMESKGFDKYVEKINDEEYHAYFFPFTELNNIEMNNHLNIDNTRIKRMLAIKLDFLNNNISLNEAKKRMSDSFDKITAQEFAIGEQHLQFYGITDDMLAEKMEDLLKVFEGILVSTELNLPKGHPLRTYIDETVEIGKVLSSMELLLDKKFIQNQWLELYDKLSEINIHLTRKQNQLFPALEKKGFDKPSKVMWTLDNNIKDIIRKSKTLLKEENDKDFLELQLEVIEMTRDMIIKETEILFPTSMELLTAEDFIEMRIGDDEIGYCLIDNPPSYKAENSPESNVINLDLLKDLTAVLQKHGVASPKKEDEILNVSQGLLTLKQINLIFKHLPMDLSYVDENDLVKFYSDTKHRVFPRSAGVIGREVQNCHPRESVHTVEEIIKAFKSGKQDEAEFWLEMGGKFIYIIYNAVRDEEGKFKGVLEMMQDVTHIRSLTGTQRLVTWKNKDNEALDTLNNTSNNQKSSPIDNNKYNITKETKIGSLVKEHPFLKDFLLSTSPKFEKLKSPILFKTMASLATIEMISERGGFELSDFIDKLVAEVDRVNNIQ
ncbi:PAS domain-containing protein [Clostridium sp. CF012]|uniref:PAS domain-containing protein n=1 Tax=Clostridium sp. CF012 TaxID=2843319 RepID=UPI001C0BB607|nr:PAS domain-containing protein [Clostridium sp. CF012]MBU3145067.1 PAS domain-containing protein [Clostridium sp. CF012]